MTRHLPLFLILLLALACTATLPTPKPCDQLRSTREAYIQASYWLARGNVKEAQSCYKVASGAYDKNIANNAEFMHDFIDGISYGDGASYGFGSGWKYVGKKTVDEITYELFFNDYGDNVMYAHTSKELPLAEVANDMQASTGVQFEEVRRGGDTIYVSDPYPTIPGVYSRVRAWTDSDGSHMLYTTFAEERQSIELEIAGQVVGTAGISLTLIGGIIICLALGAAVYIKLWGPTFKKGQKKKESSLFAPKKEKKAGGLFAPKKEKKKEKSSLFAPKKEKKKGGLFAPEKKEEKKSGKI